MQYFFELFLIQFVSHSSSSNDRRQTVNDDKPLHKMQNKETKLMIETRQYQMDRCVDFVQNKKK